jgi:hypothetical protein
MASDSGQYNGKRFEGNITKVFVLTDGSLYGAAGDADDRSLRALLEIKGDKVTDQELAELELSIDAIYVRPCGTVYLIECCSSDGKKREAGGSLNLVRAPFYAVGSGRDVAYGSMQRGGTAEQAIEDAAVWNVWTRLPVQSVRLGHGEQTAVQVEVVTDRYDVLRGLHTDPDAHGGERAVSVAG